MFLSVLYEFNYIQLYALQLGIELQGSCWCYLFKSTIQPLILNPNKLKLSCTKNCFCNFHIDVLCISPLELLSKENCLWLNALRLIGLWAYIKPGLNALAPCNADCGDRMAVRKFARWMQRERSWRLSSAGLEASVSVWAMVLSWSSMQPEAQLARDRSGHAGVCRYSPLKCHTGVSCNNRVEKWSNHSLTSVTPTWLDKYESISIRVAHWLTLHN